MTDRGLSSKEVWSLGLCVLTATCAILLLLSASSVFSAPQSTTGNLATFFAPPFEFPEGQDSLCRPADWVPPLAIPLDIRDTFGPRLLKPGEHSRYDFHRGMDWPADPDTLVYAVTTGTVRAFRDGWTDSMGSGSWYTYLPTVLRDFSSSGLEVDVQGCLDTTVRAEDLVDIYLEGNDVVVRHDKVIYNCCA